MQDVTNLKIYQNSLKLLEPIYKLANLLPKNEFELRKQLLNAARAIAPRIHGGHGKRRSVKEYCRFLEMALGSSDEVISHLREIKIHKFPGIKQETCDVLINFYKIESKQINKLISIINLGNKKPTTEN